MQAKYLEVLNFPKTLSVTLTSSFLEHSCLLPEGYAMITYRFQISKSSLHLHFLSYSATLKPLTLFSSPFLKIFLPLM